MSSLTIRSPWARVLLLACAAVVSTKPAHGINIWLSDIGQTDGTVTVGDLDMGITDPDAKDQEIHVWARPDPGETLLNWSLNLKSTNPEVIRFSEVKIYNPSIVRPPTSTQRYVCDFCVSEGTLSDNAIDHFQGIGGIGGGAGLGRISSDPFYDEASDASLVATATYETIGFGETILFLQISENGLNQSDQFSSEANVVFGNLEDPPLNGQDDRQQNSATPDATITVISPWQNPNNPLDVDNDGAILPVDVLLLINEIQDPSVSNGNTRALHIPPPTSHPPPFFDVTGDGLITAIDVLQVINKFNNLDQQMILRSAPIDLAEPRALLHVNAVPEPSTGLLLVIGLFATACVARRTS